MERTSAMNNREWLDKTCEDCEYRIDDIESHPIPARRKFPISIVIKSIIRNGGRKD